MSIALQRLRVLALGAALSAGCAAPLILAEEGEVDPPLVPALVDAGVAADEDDDPVDRDVPSPSPADGGVEHKDGGFVGPNNDGDGGQMKDASSE